MLVAVWHAVYIYSTVYGVGHYIRCGKEGREENSFAYTYRQRKPPRRIIASLPFQCALSSEGKPQHDMSLRQEHSLLLFFFLFFLLLLLFERLYGIMQNIHGIVVVTVHYYADLLLYSFYRMSLSSPVRKRRHHFINH